LLKCETQTNIDFEAITKFKNCVISGDVEVPVAVEKPKMISNDELIMGFDAIN